MRKLFETPVFGHELLNFFQRQCEAFGDLPEEAQDMVLERNQEVQHRGWICSRYKPQDLRALCIDLLFLDERCTKSLHTSAQRIILVRQIVQRIQQGECVVPAPPLTSVWSPEIRKHLSESQFRAWRRLAVAFVLYQPPNTLQDVRNRMSAVQTFFDDPGMPQDKRRFVLRMRLLEWILQSYFEFQNE